MIIDVFVIVILLVGAFLGWKKGLVRMISGWLGWLLVPYIAFRFAGGLAEIVNREFALGGKIAAFLVQHQMFLKIGELVNLIMMPLDYFAKQIFGRATGLTAAGTTPAALAGSLGRTTIILACFFILLVGAKWGLRLFSSLITRGLDFTLIGAVNHFCGGALSAAATFIILALALLVISRLAAGNAADGGLWAYLHQSFGQSSIGTALIQAFSRQFGPWVKI